MPPTQDVRSGLGAVGAAGDTYQDKVVSQVETVFGSDHVICSPNKQPGKNRPQTIDLEQHIHSLKANQFVVESKFSLSTAFVQRLGIGNLHDDQGRALEFSDLNPDIILVGRSRLQQMQDPISTSTGAGGSRSSVGIRGKAANSDCDHAVLPDGNLVRLTDTDDRLQLRVIDVKLASEPGAHYFAEVVYYSMALAAWLEEKGLQDRFVVAANGAVWPGSYESSELWKRYATGVRDNIPASVESLIDGMEVDLEPAEFSVYAPRVRQFLQRDLSRMISTPWNDLPWHVNFRCGGCDFLGYDWNIPGKAPDPRQCWPTASSTDHLSRIHGLSKGAAEVLRPVAPTVEDVSLLSPEHPVFSSQSALRAKKNVIVARARSLTHNTSGGIEGSGASAVIPKYADLKIFVTLDYDPSSAITAAISVRASWREPVPYGVERLRAEERWGDKAHGLLTFIVDEQELEAEKREFLRFLRQLKAILDQVRGLDDTRLASQSPSAGQGGAQASDPSNSASGSGTNSNGANSSSAKEKRSTYQIYLWDNAQFRHLTRLVSRYLTDILNDPNLRNLAWLFPSEELLPDPENATRHSPISLVGEAVENHLAVPVPHYYSLYDVAQSYLAPDAPPKILDLYRDPLTNLIPPERIHELWTRDPNWKTTLNRIEETSGYKTLALALLTDKLTKDPAIQLASSIAPVLGPQSGKTRSINPIKATPEGLLWYEFTRLCAALAEVETQMYYALPPTEREARFGSAHLVRRLSGDEEKQAFETINATCNTTLLRSPDLWVYELSAHSCDVKIKTGDFTWALSPRNENMFLNKSILFGSSPRLPNAAEYYKERNQSIGDAGLTQVSLEAIDRQNRLVALRLDGRNCIKLMERYGDADFRQDVMLDQTALDILSKKVKSTLEGIGQPLNGHTNSDILAALSKADIKPQARNRKHVEAHDFLYDPTKLSQQEVSRSVGLKEILIGEGLHLNSSQWDAWEGSLTRRLSLIWGPPGTGKSETLRAIVRGAVLDAQQKNQTLRLLVTANNYNAVDNVLLDLEKHFRPQVEGDDSIRLFRIERKGRGSSDFASKYPGLTNIELDKNDPDSSTQELLELLNPQNQTSTAQTSGTQIVIVGTIPHQIHNLAYVQESGVGAPIKTWFDLVLLDEASQMDVASSTIVFSKIAPDGSCVLAGDDLQLPPIQQAEPPKGLEALVGSVYGLMRSHYDIAPAPLNLNYRSNRTIVDFIIEAGYEPKLCAHSPDLKLRLAEELPDSEPAGWPSQIPFSPDWRRLLDPHKPLTCYIYDDQISGQSNLFEAQAVAALIKLLHGNLGRPLNRRDKDGVIDLTEYAPYTDAEFWQKGIGVVAPHRAQGSRITDLLREVFPVSAHTTPAMIAGAVDTVERYQGQQRDVIIASFGLGDPEVIASEDEFLYDLRRFNVMISRACTKVIVLMTRSVLEHLSNDQDILRESGLLKHFAEHYCTNDEALDLPHLDPERQPLYKNGIMRTA